ncbi:MAG: alpha-amylase family glycosyl hydrolase [Bacteroidota bacterium]
MYNYALHKQLRSTMANFAIDIQRESDELFYARFLANIAPLQQLFFSLYGNHANYHQNLQLLLATISKAHASRPQNLRQKDWEKMQKGTWFTSNELAGMSLYVDRFCGDINALQNKLPYLQNLGVNLLHLMPIFESPDGESDGGYAVSDFRKVDARFGTLHDLQALQKNMHDAGMYLMIDIVFNHTSHLHEWAMKAKAGDETYQDFFYMYNDRGMPDWFETAMPEIFPEAAPGNFTYVEECKKWVMTVFHNYQWDLNYSNPAVFIAMLDTVFFYANLGVDVLRIDAPAFIWKQPGTTCQNLPQAHTILQLLRLCVEVATPGMALLGEAIVAPRQIMQYFGTGTSRDRECDFAYNATQMALQWDMLATGKTTVMMAAQHVLLQKPLHTSWITYTRCHDDIGLGFDDEMIREAGYNAYEHRKYLQNYYSGTLNNSPATGALFSVNHRTGDARISGTLASLCGLEKALNENNETAVAISVQKILLMQAHSFFIGGLPMLFYGDECGYTNDYSYLKDAGKSYDNRWMHRPVIDWKKNALVEVDDTVEQKIFSGTQKLLRIRKQLIAVADENNLTWLSPHNIHVAGFMRKAGEQILYCLFNFNNTPSYLTWYALKEKGFNPQLLRDHWTGKEMKVGADHEYLILGPYQFCLLEQL